MEETEETLETFDLDLSFIDFMEKERRQVEGKIRIVNCNFSWLKQGEIIQILDINIAQVKIKSLNTGNTGWLWRMELTDMSDRVENGI